jgi:hypothetical protein
MSHISTGGYVCHGRKWEHRMVWSAMYGTIPEGKEVDHINGDKQDNRLENLRLVTRQENMRNAKKSNANTSGCTGITWSKAAGKWQAQTEVTQPCGKRKGKYLGVYDDWFDAVCARMSANNLYNFHANHGRR